MAKISPFKALRPTRDKVHLVATRPYYTYKKNVLEAKLQDNPYTFLHIINPEFGNPIKTEPNSVERFNLICDAYQEFINEGILVQDQEPHFYIYRQTKDGHEYLGIVGGASIEEYEQDKIKKHEATLTSREAMFVEYLDIVGYNAEPVLLSYSDPDDRIELLMNLKTLERPEYEYTTTDRIKHELWLFNTNESVFVQQAFKEIDALYIADGHHRSASSVGLKNLRQSKEGIPYPNEQFFLAYFLNEKRMQILEFNRLVRSLQGLSEEQLIAALTENFTITQLKSAQKPTDQHEITMCVRGNWYQLICHTSIVDHQHPVNCLDAEILTQFVLHPLLGISDLKTDENIQFIPGTEALEKTESRIVKGEFEIGFFLFPVNIEQIKRVADNGMTMPPKSTWIEPKLRSGLTIYNINE